MPESEKIQQLASVHASRRRVKETDTALMADPARFAELIHPEKLRFLMSQHPGIDLQDMFGRFVLWNSKRGTQPRDVLAAFSGFIREHQSRQRRVG